MVGWRLEHWVVKVIDFGLALVVLVLWSLKWWSVAENAGIHAESGTAAAVVRKSEAGVQLALRDHENANMCTVARP